MNQHTLLNCDHNCRTLHAYNLAVKVLNETGAIPIDDDPVDPLLFSRSRSTSVQAKTQRTSSSPKKLQQKQTISGKATMAQADVSIREELGEWMRFVSTTRRGNYT